MRYRHLFIAIGICAISTSANASSQSFGIERRAEVTCFGNIAPGNDGRFELACKIHKQETQNDKGSPESRQHLPLATSEKTRGSEVPGCDEPGDVIEQGFCLD